MNRDSLAAEVRAALAEMAVRRGAPPQRAVDSIRIRYEGELTEQEAARQIAEALYDLPGE